jgi:uncharacterized protein
MRILVAALGAVCALAMTLQAPAARAAAGCQVPTFTYKHGVVSFNEHGDITRVDVEVADSEFEREVGLMCRASLAPNSGMLFEFDTVSTDAFWMKNTLIPLSIAFLDADWRIVTLLDMPVAPNPLTGPYANYSATGPYRYAIEVNEGFFDHHGITPSALVTFVPIGARAR